MKRLTWLVVAFLFLATGMAQIELDPKIETVLLQLEQELTEYQQRVLAERLVVIRVPIDQLLRTYQTNEKNANKLYKGNLVEFTGRIVDIARQGKLYLFLESPQAPRPLMARCGFARRQQEQLAILRVDDIVTVQGKSAGMPEGFVAVNNCQFVRR